MADLRKELKKACPFTHIFEDKDPGGRPKSEMGYFRCDYDGYRWWNTAWPVNNDIETPELIEEFDSVYSDFMETFPSLKDLEKYCMQLEPTSDRTEYNTYLSRKHGWYWLRIITRKGDYNLYLHCYKKTN